MEAKILHSSLLILHLIHSVLIELAGFSLAVRQLCTVTVSSVTQVTTRNEARKIHACMGVFSANPSSQ